MKNLWLAGMCIMVLQLFSQVHAQSVVFSQEQFVWYVKNHHPVVVQAGLLLDQGESAVRKARGDFDPVIQADLDQKYYDDKTYYSLLGAGLKIPTWYGIELETGFDQNRGVFLNPENNVPEGGLWYAGISVPIGQGLFIDERRAVLKQAQIFAQSTIAEQERILNNLFFEAIKAYWRWAEAWNQYQVFEESVELAIVRYNAVKQSYLFGDLPAIDTLEAFIQVQNRQMNRNEYQLFYQNLTLELSNFLWLENNTPLVITDALRPPELEQYTTLDIIPTDTLQSMLVDLEAGHPEMQLYDFKLESMEVEKRMMREELKPTINLDYNALFGEISTEPTRSNFPTDYTWGLEFKFPLFLRKERGNLQLTRLKIQDTELDQRQKLLELQNKLRSYYNEQVNLVGQVELFTDAVNNYERLLRGEQQKFDSGESSLFLINSREISLIQAELKLIELISKFNVADNGLVWATGKLHLE
jgi:outer membrane protein TolC